MLFEANILKSKGVTILLVVLCLSLVAANLRVVPSEDFAQVSGDAGATQEAEDAPVLSFKISDALQSAAHISLDFQSILLDVVILDEEKEEGNLADQFFIGQTKAGPAPYTPRCGTHIYF